MRVLSSEGQPSGILSTEDDVFVEVDFVVRRENANLCVGFTLLTARGSQYFELIKPTYQSKTGYRSGAEATAGVARFQEAC